MQIIDEVTTVSRAIVTSAKGDETNALVGPVASSLEVVETVTSGSRKTQETTRRRHLRPSTLSFSLAYGGRSFSFCSPMERGHVGNGDGVVFIFSSNLKGVIIIISCKFPP